MKLPAIPLLLLLVLAVGCSETQFDGAPRNQASEKKAKNGAGSEEGPGDLGDKDSGIQGQSPDASGPNRPDSGDDAGDDGNPGGVDAGGDDEGGTPSTDDGETSSKCDVPRGNTQTVTTLGGEDVPGNGLLGGPDEGKPFGGDFNDYILTLNGSLLVQRDLTGAKATIGSAQKGTVSVSYARGSSDCSHRFRFLLRKCPNRNSKVLKTFDLDAGSGSSGQVTLDIPASKLFLDVELTTTASATKHDGGCPLPFPVTNLLYGGVNVVALVH